MTHTAVRIMSEFGHDDKLLLSESEIQNIELHIPSDFRHKNCVIVHSGKMYKYTPAKVTELT